MSKGTLALAIVLGGALGAMAQFGTYDYMRTKKGMGRWKAGLASGALLSSIGVGIMYVTGGFDGMKAAQDARAGQTPALAGLTAQQIGGLYVSPARGLTGLVAQRVAGF